MRLRAARYTVKYKNWRKKVFSRDKYTCRKCLKTGGYIEAHHIKKKSTYPSLMFVVANGITLCKPCHVKVTGDEEAWQYAFFEIVRHNVFDKKKIEGIISNVRSKSNRNKS